MDSFFEQDTMPATRHLTAFFCVALIFGASRDLRTQRAPEPGQGALQAKSAASAAALNKYCATCHNEKVRAGGLALEKLNPDDPGTDAAAWEKVVRKLRTGAMPPAGRPRPDRATYDAVASHLEAKLEAAASSHPNPGRLPLFHRLTRTEYKNAIRDLLGLDDLSKDVDLDLLLPADNSSSGFDNIADLLFVSSTQLEQYLSAAQKLSSVAVGDPSLPPLVDLYRMSDQFNQEYQAEGAPFGTRGGTVIRTYLPLDGEYRIHIELADAAREPHQIEIAVDDERVRLIAADVQGNAAADDSEKKDAPTPDAAASDDPTVAEKLDEIATPIKINSVVNRRFELDRRNEARRRALAKGIDVDLPMKAGPRVIAVTFLKRTSAKGESLIRPRLRGRGQLPAIASVTLRGPRKVAGTGDTPSRRRIFVCSPANAADLSAGALAKAEDLPCAKKILSSLARRAYRRPVNGCRSAAGALDLRGRARGRRFRGRHQAGARANPGEPPVPVPYRASAGEGLPPARSIGSAISSSHRVCRFSCGAAFRTTSCSISPRAAGSAIEPCSISRCGGCFAILVPKRSPRILPRNGCTCATWTRRHRVRGCFPTSI